MPAGRILNLRGTSGAGKTHAVRLVLQALAAAAGPAAPLRDSTGSVLGYEAPTPTGPPVYVVGSYEATSGGCDTIRTQGEACERVRQYAARGHVLFEGLLVSGNASRYARLADELGRDRFLFAYLDTPLDLCLHTAQARRQARQADQALDPANTISRFKGMWGTYRRLRAAGYRTAIIPHADPAPPLLAWFNTPPRT